MLLVGKCMRRSISLILLSGFIKPELKGLYGVSDFIFITGSRASSKIN